jgi:hypothetical protein
VVLALVLALMFNGGSVLLFEVLRDRLPEPDEFEDTLGYPVLASIPSLRLKPLTAVVDGAPDGSFERKPAMATQSGAGDGQRESDT